VVPFGHPLHLVTMLVPASVVMTDMEESFVKELLFIDSPAIEPSMVAMMGADLSSTEPIFFFSSACNS